MPVLADKHHHDTKSRPLPLPERRLTSIGTPALAQSTTTPTPWLAEWRLGLKMKPSGAPRHTHSTSPRQPAQPREAGETPRNPHVPVLALLGRCSPSWVGTPRRPPKKGPQGQADSATGCPWRPSFLVPVFCPRSTFQEERDRGNPALPFPRTWAHASSRRPSHSVEATMATRRGADARDPPLPESCQTPLVLPIPSVGCGAKTSPG